MFIFQFLLARSEKGKCNFMLCYFVSKSLKKLFNFSLTR